MKLSAYVSERLWERVQARFPGARPSQVAQVALRRLVERSRPRFVPAPDVEAEGDLTRRRARVSEVRQRAYDEGYEAGLAYAAGLRWSDLERLAAADWAIVETADGADPRRASVAHRAGMRDALREVWLAVLQATAAS